jgi:hypothetical protein
MPFGVIRFGSLRARIIWHGQRRGEDVAWIFGTPLNTHATELLRPVDFELVFPEIDERPTRPCIPFDGMVLCGDHPRREIHTEVVSAVIDLAPDPVRVEITIREAGIAHFDLCVHLTVVLHKILFILGRVVLHAAAVRFAGRVSLFLGDKGAGKTTSSLRLGREGATVLGEDHIILRRGRDGFRVSGCDERSRLDAKTERHFFPGLLSAQPCEFAGILKKEVPAREVFDSQPYTDHRPDLVCFTRVGQDFAITPLPRQAAVLRLMRAAGKLQRFVDPRDSSAFLDLLLDFSRTVAAYDLELSPDLHELDRLVDFLHAEPLAALSVS